MVKNPTSPLRGAPWALVAGAASILLPSPTVGDLVEKAMATGLVFEHFNGMSGELYYNEMVGAGVALFDYDRDGDLDVYLGQGTMLGAGKSIEDATFQPRYALPLSDRLFRNDTSATTAEPRFVDVTDEAGIVAPGYAMGVAVGDVDDDGFDDLYVANHGANQLWRNRGDGTFEDITSESGSDDPRWSTSAAFVDFDQDGALDLFVVNYVRYSPDAHKGCLSASGTREYCGPFSYQGEPDRLLRNLGGGKFSDVSFELGVSRERASGLGVVVADFNLDGRHDIYVANDLMRNHLWMNLGQEGLVDDALLTGTAVNSTGSAEASMGVVAGDLDNDGDDDLFLTHLTGETNTVYVNDGQGFFVDSSSRSGLGSLSRPYTGFGAALVDLDSDGHLDVLAVNGSVRRIEEQMQRRESHPLSQPNQLFRNLGGGVFEDVTAAEPALQRSLVSRGAAIGDLDNDGDPDIVITNNAGPAGLLLNMTGDTDGWLGIAISGRPGGSPALGARGQVKVGRAVIARSARPSGSFLSSSDPRLHIGIGAAGNGPFTTEIDWPAPTHCRLRAPLLANRYSVMAPPRSCRQGQPR